MMLFHWPHKGRLIPLTHSSIGYVPCTVAALLDKLLYARFIAWNPSLTRQVRQQPSGQVSTASVYWPPVQAKSSYLSMKYHFEGKHNMNSGAPKLWKMARNDRHRRKCCKVLHICLKSLPCLLWILQECFASVILLEAYLKPFSIRAKQEFSGII